MTSIESDQSIRCSIADCLSLVVRYRSSGFPTSYNTNRAVQSQKIVRGLKFWIEIGKGLYYPCTENKGADQLHGYREADMRLCFRICKKPVFSRRGSFRTLLIWQAQDNSNRIGRTTYLILNVGISLMCPSDGLLLVLTRTGRTTRRLERVPTL